MDKKLYETYREIEDTHWWFVGRRKIVLDIFERFSLEKSTTKILDFGCNTGVLVGILQRDGWNISGSDISGEAIEYGQKRGIKNLSVADGVALPYMDASFDAVLCLDVLEHIEDDSFALKEIWRVLKPGGRAIIMVPAFRFLWGVQDVVAHHYRRYSIKMINELVSNGKWSIDFKSYFNFLLFPLIAIVRLLQRFWKPKRQSDFELNNKFFNFILTKIFLSEAAILRFVRYPWGISILAVLHKKE